MKVFEHTIAADGLTRLEIWGALERLMRHPELILVGCEHAVIRPLPEQDGLRWIERRSVFGDLEITDSVMFEDEKRVEIHVPAGPSWPRSWQTILLEDTDEGIVLRFTYEQETFTPAENPAFDELRFQAYRNKDETLMQLIRQSVE